MNSRKKRKLTTANDIDEDDNEDNIFRYSLNKLKALQKKIDSTTTDDSITIKGNPDNIQVVVDCNTAVFELVKSVFQASIQEQHLYVSKKMNRDRNKNVVATIFTIKNKKKADKLYTANFFHTTSKIHVNAIKDVDLFIGHYSKLVNQFSPETIATLNREVRSSCANAMHSLNTSSQDDCSGGKTNMPPDTPNASLIPLPESSNCSLSDTMETASPSHSEDRDSEKHPTCMSCKSLQSIITVMMEKMNDMQCQLDAQNKLLRESLGPGKLEATIRKELNSITSLVSKYPSTMESQTDSRNTAQQMHFPTDNTTQQWSDIVSSNRQLQNNNPKPTTNQSTPTPSTSNRLHHPPSTTRKPARVNNFNPKHCIVISISKSSKTYSDYNQDHIRREINRNFGPTIIENITTYNFKTASPKIMIHLRDEETVTKLINTWNPFLFDNSQVRRTINPELAKINTGMLRGIPIDADDDIVTNEITQTFPNSTAERIFKGGKKMRIFKIKFGNQDQYHQVLSQGMILESLKLKCHFEKLL